MAEKSESGMSYNKEKALIALARQPTLGLAAAEVGISERTLYRWLHQDAAFQTEYLRIRREVVSNAIFQLQKACNNAVNCLQSVVNDPEAPASARTTAARTILEMSMNALQIEELELRLSQLEQQIALTKFNGHNNGGHKRWIYEN
jgi:hypothetical protein